MENNTFEILNLFIVTTFAIFICIAFVFILIFKLKKKQLTISNSMKIMKLNHENELLTYRIEIQESTFTEIAREIHDNISLSLTLAKLNLNTLNINIPNEDQIKINNSIDLISKSLIDLNNLSKSIDGDIIEKYGLIAALENEISSINKIGTVAVHIQINGHDRYLEHSSELAIFRIIQEAIKNSLTHAKANVININFNFTNQYLIVDIKDDGVGFVVNPINPSKISCGLKNMENRAKLINGEIDLQSIIGKGTTITLKIPTDLKHGKK